MKIPRNWFRGCTLAASGLLALLLAGAPLLASTQKLSKPEKFLFNALNRERVMRGLRPLRWDAALAKAAQGHTFLMAQKNLLSHQLPGEPDLQERAAQAGARFSQIAENIGEASAVPDLHYGWMQSPPHRENLLNPVYTSVGIALVQKGGAYYAAEDFSVASEELSLREQEKQIGKLLEARGLRVTLGSSEARSACSANGASPRQTSGAFVHFETPDLTQLPSELEKLISRGQFRTAEVGACQPAAAGGFTRYHLAVLLH